MKEKKVASIWERKKIHDQSRCRSKIYGGKTLNPGNTFGTGHLSIRRKEEKKKQGGALSTQKRTERDSGDKVWRGVGGGLGGFGGVGRCLGLGGWGLGFVGVVGGLGVVGGWGFVAPAAWGKNGELLQKGKKREQPKGAPESRKGERRKGGGSK